MKYCVALSCLLALALLFFKGCACQWDVPMLSREEVEEEIVNMLDGRIEMPERYNSKRDAMAFEYRDLNEDGIEEVIVQNRSNAGAQNAAHYIFKTRPVEMILGSTEDGVWCAGLEILKVSHKGYFDLRSSNHHSAFEAGVVLWRWNGRTYEDVGGFLDVDTLQGDQR